MFTGLVEAIADVVELLPQPPGVRLALRCPEISDEIKIGDSIAINGCCLTVVETKAGVLAFEAGPETIVRTNLGKLISGSRVNFERSLRVGDRMGGHFVTGHIDGIGTLAERWDEAGWSTFWFAATQELIRFMASKGSITIDGVSLTLVDVEPNRFSVALIPHTLSVTTLGQLKAGDPVNLETDLLAKYVLNARA